MNLRWLPIALIAGCSGAPPKMMQAAGPPPTSSSTIALTSDDHALWVVNPDADSVSVIDPAARSLVREIPLGSAPPAIDPTTQRYEPAVKPRALAILADKKVYVAGQTANRIFVIDAAQMSVVTSIPVGAEPTGVVAAPDGKTVYAVSHQSAQVAKIDPSSDTVVAMLPIGEHPWGASVSSDGKTLYVSQFLLHPGVTVIDTASFTVRNTVELAEQPPNDAVGKVAPNGLARGVYAAVPRPMGGDVWMPHLLLAVKTPEPDLDFQSTVFPTISTLAPDGMAEAKRLLFQPLDPPGAMGSFTDVVSGPRAIAFTPDGALGLVAMSQSEDVMVFDGATGVERGLVRPLPSTFLEGIAVDHKGAKAYVDGRNSHDVTVLAVNPTDDIAPVTVDGGSIERFAAADPMPAGLRLGQRLFYTANSAVFPITRNFWVACSSCHLEGGTDAVTWRFTVGPRDTPSNAGGPINTGFLLRQALRASVVDYDTTINIEQGGAFHRTNGGQLSQLDALRDFVNFAIPFPQNPNVASGGPTAAQQHGATLFGQLCASCHAGAFFTDSGAGNPTLDLNGTIVLHNVGTCVTSGDFIDQPAPDEEVGKMHTACDFDTPTLRGLHATAPYFHDGSAPTIRAVLDRLPFSSSLSDGDKGDLEAYLLSL
jgi:YVTN family beta-propeller protein